METEREGLLSNSELRTEAQVLQEDNFSVRLRHSRVFLVYTGTVLILVTILLVSTATSRHLPEQAFFAIETASVVPGGTRPGVLVTNERIHHFTLPQRSVRHDC